MVNLIFTSEGNKKKPITVIIYAIFGLLLSLILLLQYPLFISPSFKLIGTNPTSYLKYLVDFIITCLLLLPSIGVLYGKIWSWNLSIFFLLSSSVRSSLFISELFYQFLPSPSVNLTRPSHIAITVISLIAYLILINLFLKEPIVGFFDIEHDIKLKYLRRISILSLIFGPVIWILSRRSSSST